MPPRAMCECGKDKLVPFTFAGKGVIISYTEIHVAPAGFEMQVPYNIALIKLEEGPVISGAVVDKKIKIGEHVRSIFRRLQVDGEGGLISYGFKFELDR